MGLIYISVSFMNVPVIYIHGDIYKCGPRYINLAFCKRGGVKVVLS
jgi:hypothetical protein